MAEAVRGYMLDPNYLKTVAPKTAARIREYVNGNPALNKTIQFNSLAGVGSFGALAFSERLTKSKVSTVDSIIGVESGGNPNAAILARRQADLGNSSIAHGPMIQKHRPDLAQGKASRDELIAPEVDPDLSREMTAAYAADNGKS